MCYDFDSNQWFHYINRSSDLNLPQIPAHLIILFSSPLNKAGKCGTNGASSLIESPIELNLIRQSGTYGNAIYNEFWPTFPIE